MRELRLLSIISILLLVLCTGGMASGQCVADGNNSTADATIITSTETVSDYVCPADLWDFYKFEVKQGESLSGTVTFMADQTGTTFRISGPSGTLIEKGSTDTQRILTANLDSSTLTAGTYYLRVGFYSKYASDHSYSITMNLLHSGGGGSSPGTGGRGSSGAQGGCAPDNNESPSTAGEIYIDTMAPGWVCGEDPLDLWHLDVPDSVELAGSLTVTAESGDVILQLQDSNQAILAEAETVDGRLTLGLGSNAPVLVPGDYYIAVMSSPGFERDVYYTILIEQGNPPAEPAGWEPATATIIDNVDDVIKSHEQLFVKIMIDSFYCIAESASDQSSDSDEPYFLIYGFSTTKNPNVWSTGDPQIFGDVDAGEVNRFTWGQRWVGWENPGPDTIMGFHVGILEEDDVDNTFIKNLQTNTVYEIGKAIDDNKGKSKTELKNAIHGSTNYYQFTYDDSALLGKHDFVGSHTEIFDKIDLVKWSNVVHRPFEFDIDGGSEGHYRVRWHLEFDPDASKYFSQDFNEYDEIAVGNVMSDSKDEIVIASHGAVPGVDGRFYIYDGTGKQLTTFDQKFAALNRMTVGDIDNDGFDEIVVASYGDGYIRGYNADGSTQVSFKAPVPLYVGLAAVDVGWDDGAEILFADGFQVIIFSGAGAQLHAFPIVGWTFNGTRNTGPDTQHDAFLVGDVIGDSTPEIVFIDNQHGSGSQVHLYAPNSTGVEIVKFGLPQGTFTYHDASCLGNVLGDSKLELFLASDQGDGNFGCKIMAFDMTSRTKVLERYYPMYTIYDGFASGDVLGIGRDMFIVATDEDNKIWVGM